MKTKNSRRGSALLLSLVIVIIAAGIGGAFLTQAILHSNEQKWSIEADEALTMCDAGMERARQALGLYKGKKLWAWSEIAAFCAARPSDGISIRNSSLTLFKAPEYAAYAGAIFPSGGGTVNVALDNTDPALCLPTIKGGDDAKVLFGRTMPFHRGTIYVNIAAPAGTPVGTEPENLVVTITATLQSGIQRQVEGVLSKPASTLKAPGLAAVVSNDAVALNGSITIDGRDHDYAGTKVTGPGVFGIISNEAMSDPSNGSVGGNGNAPPNPKGAAAGSVKGNYPFTGGYPSGPDAVLTQEDGSPLKDGSLKKAAQDGNMYFNSQTAFDAWLSTQGGKIPDGAIVYLEFTPGNGQFNLGSGNSKSSILIIHTEAQSGIIKEVHGNFTGLIMADGFVRNNGTSHITGMVQLFSPSASEAGNVFGNGNAEIDFSSAALADLPGMSGGDSAAKLVSYRRLQ